MPIYEYKCRKCSETFETLIRKSTDEPQCPLCQSKDVDRLMSAPAAHTDASSHGGGHSPGAGGCCGDCGCCCGLR
ncbi:MAG: FmdB family zinc ribbon protein [Thermoguttaceae bacterium]